MPMHVLGSYAVLAGHVRYRQPACSSAKCLMRCMQHISAMQVC